MPVYEFDCRSCGEEFEKLVRFSESTKDIECPHCQSRDTQKRLSMVASTHLNGRMSSSAASIGSCGDRGGFT
jgi:putative FmdB family regulatory protein